MNAKMKMIFLLALLSTFVNAAEQTMTHDLPSAVKQTVDRERGADPVKRVTRETVDGRAVYLVEIEKNNAPNPRLRITEDGAVLQEPVISPMLTPGGAVAPINPEVYANASVAKGRPMVLSDLPAEVQKTVRAQAGNRVITEIDREMWGEQAVYEIEFKERGPNSRVYVREDGQVVREDQKSDESARRHFVGMQVSDTPLAVQRTIRRLVDQKEITAVDKKTERGEMVYRFEVRGTQERRELKIGEDGRVVSDAREPAPDIDAGEKAHTNEARSKSK